MSSRDYRFRGLPGHTPILTRFLDVETIASILVDRCAFLDHPACPDCSCETHLIGRGIRTDAVGQFELRVYLCSACGHLHQTKVR